MNRFLRRASKLVAVSTAGFVLLAAGVLLSLPGIPGPGLALIVAGLAVLATEFAWARRLRDQLLDRLRMLRDRVTGRASTPTSSPEAPPPHHPRDATRSREDTAA